MPHAAIIAAAVSAGVGGAIAFELGVFKPWREEHWPNGIAQGIRQEWQEFADDVREGFREISGEGARHRRGFQQHFQHGSEAEDEMELRREMDEFSLHETQVSSVRARLATEFQDGQGGARRRKRDGGSLMAIEKDNELVKAPRLNYSQAEDADSCVISPHHDVGEASPTVTNTSLPAEEERIQPVDAVSPSTPRSPESLYEHIELPNGRPTDGASVSSSDDWHNGLCSPRPTSHNASDGESDSWTQLYDSRSASPVSPSWSEAGLTRASR